MILGTNKWSENAVLFLHETFHHSELGWVHVAHPGLWIFEPAAAPAKSCQSCLTVWPHRWQPTRFRHPWDSPGKDTGVGCHFLLQSMKVKSESEVAQSCLTLSDPMLPGSSVHGIFQARDYIWDTVLSVDHAVDNVGVCFCETRKLLKEKSGQISWVWSHSNSSLYNLGKSFCASPSSFINRDYSNSPSMGFLR